ncbi:pectinesterase inhibitor-like [Malania oleifera]|uniref:pectinesterase inhibitor-like n=1 Tax=Malania oleifera TaxID=397392 RepID=UPI0025ADA3C3|nr:pectinesterase inhibitor-like [Malania oleifera]
MALKLHASFSPVFLVAATALLLFVLPSASAIRGAGAHSGNTNLCAHADYQALCKAVVKKEVHPAAATEKAIQAALKQANSAKSLAAKLEAAKKGAARGAFDTCNDNFDDAISSLQTSLTSLKAKDKGTLSTNLSAVISDTVTCGDGLSEGPAGFGADLVKANQLLRQHASNCLALAEQVH